MVRRLDYNNDISEDNSNDKDNDNDNYKLAQKALNKVNLKSISAYLRHPSKFARNAMIHLSLTIRQSSFFFLFLLIISDTTLINDHLEIMVGDVACTILHHPSSQR